MFKRWLAALVIALSLTACLRTPLPLDTLRFDTTSTTTVLAADYNPGLPALDFQTSCPPDTIPLLRVWGDGLVFLDVLSTDKAGIQTWETWTGRLSAAQIRAALVSLSDQGYLDGWTPGPADGPNPAAVFIELSAHLADRSIDHGSGDTSWPLYAALVAQLLPTLHPLSPGPGTDPRLARLVADSRICATPTLP